MTPIGALDIIRHPQSGDDSDIKEAIRRANSALKKQIPKKLRVDDEGWLCCPKCNETFKLHNQYHERNRHCGNCGQALDWGDGE